MAAASTADAATGNAQWAAKPPSLTKCEWESMEGALDHETALTHRRLAGWIHQEAARLDIRDVVSDEEEEAEEATDGGGSVQLDEEEESVAAKSVQPDEECSAAATQSSSTVQIFSDETKLQYRGHINAVNMTNWVWECGVRPKLEESKGKVTEVVVEGAAYHGLLNLHDVLREFLPEKVRKRVEKKTDEDDGADEGADDGKKDKKDKKDKRDKKEKKDKKDKKDDDKKKPRQSVLAMHGKQDKLKKKDDVKLKSGESIQVKNLVSSMIFAPEVSKGQSISGWVNWIDQPVCPLMTPWEFQLANVLHKVLSLEYAAKKNKKEAAGGDPLAYYSQVQCLSDALMAMRQQYEAKYTAAEREQLLPLREAEAVLLRFTEGATGGVKFDIHWYLRAGAHLIAGSSFSQRHAGRTQFSPFDIQRKMVQSMLKPGPQLVFAIAPPGCGKTAIVPHMLKVFPTHSLVFVCHALPVVLNVGQIAFNMGIPYAFVKNYCVTPGYSCGRGLGGHVDVSERDALTGEVVVRGAVHRLFLNIDAHNKSRKQRRLAQTKKKRSAMDFKKMPRLYLVQEPAIAPWLLKQLDPELTLMMVDEPPMGADKVPQAPEDNKMALAMADTLLNPVEKTCLMCATMPQPEQLPTMVTNFLDKFQIDPAKQSDHVFVAGSTQLDRGVVMVRPSGKIAFPHDGCTTAAALRVLVERLGREPLVLKAYTERAVADMLLIIEAMGGAVPDSVKVVGAEERFKDVSTLRHDSLREYAIEILAAVSSSDDDDFVARFCDPTRPAVQEANGDARGAAAAAAAIAVEFPPFDLGQLLFKNAYAFPGCTLVADSDPIERCKQMAKPLLDTGKLGDISVEGEKSKAAAKKEQDDDEDGTDAPEDNTRLRFDPSVIIQTAEFYQRWCPADKKDLFRFARRVPDVLEFRAIDALPVQESWKQLLLAGLAAYDPRLDKDPKNPIFTQFVHESMQRNRMACVVAGNEFTWGANVPASTVAVTASFAEKTSVSGILQYVGRAARRGLTTHGQALFERDEDLARVFELGGGQKMVEADTLERYCRWIKGGRTPDAWVAADQSAA